MSEDKNKIIDNEQLENVNAGSLGDVIKKVTSKVKPEEEDPTYVALNVDNVPRGGSTFLA
ncbi:MAG: hypothetical protein J6O03_04505 [Butyrivibrio sp.]|nr:hypothetical protein [Butyrivibrio sp.]